MPALPPPRELLHPPATPFDRSLARRLAPAFALIAAARPVVPPEARVTVTSEPLDPALDNMTHRLAVALLPGRNVIPAAVMGASRPELAAQAEYVVVVGRQPFEMPGDLLLARPEGTVWRRKSP
ncbi:MAG: hypothetical protein ACRD1B_06820 [Thermoanaerobaculia bacterium]